MVVRQKQRLDATEIELLTINTIREALGGEPIEMPGQNSSDTATDKESAKDFFKRKTQEIRG